MFYTDYVRNLQRGNHIVIILLTNAYLQYGSFGYERTVDLNDLVWC